MNAGHSLAVCTAVDEKKNVIPRPYSTLAGDQSATACVSAHGFEVDGVAPGHLPFVPGTLNPCIAETIYRALCLLGLAYSCSSLTHTLTLEFGP